MQNPKDFDAIRQRIQGAESWRDNNYTELWKKCLKQYRSRKVAKDEGRSNIFVPYTFMQVEVIKSRIAESLFSSKPFITVLPREDNDTELAEHVQSLLSWQFTDRMDIERIFSEHLLADIAIFGTGISYTGWLTKKRKTKHRGKVNRELTYPDSGAIVMGEDGMPVIVEMTEVVEDEETDYDDPIVQKIDLFDFYTDPMSSDIRNARFCGHREWLSKEAIKDLEETAGWSVNWDSVHADDTVTGGKRIRADIGSGKDVGEDESTEENGMYKVTHYWEDNRHVVIVGDSVCALDEENPFWHGMKPYDKCCYVTLSGEFYGMGIPEILFDLQAELNTNRNQRIDYMSMALRRMWKLRRGCGLTARDLIWKQGGVIQVEEMDDVQEIQVSPLPASAFSHEEGVKQDMRDATGCHDIIMGLGYSANETATTTMTKDNNASIRFKDVVKAVVQDLLVPIAKKCVSLDQQFMGEDRFIRLSSSIEPSASLLTVSPDDLVGCYDVSYVGTTIDAMANKELNKQKVQETYGLAMQNPLVQNDPQSMRALLRELLMANDINNVDDILPAEMHPMPMGPEQMQQPNPVEGMTPLNPGEQVM